MANWSENPPLSRGLPTGVPTEQRREQPGRVKTHTPCRKLSKCDGVGGVACIEEHPRFSVVRRWETGGDTQRLSDYLIQC